MVGISTTIDAIVVGSGLAGLTATLHILDRGGNVVVLEKEQQFGGNSMKASSGINAAFNNHTRTSNASIPTDDNIKEVDSSSSSSCPSSSPSSSSSSSASATAIESFRNDTIRSAGSLANYDLIDTLVTNSVDAITWLQKRVGVDLSMKSQLGGHTENRTYRPSQRPVGAELMIKLQRLVKSYEASGQVSLLVDCRVTRLLTDNATGRVIGVEYEDSSSVKKSDDNNDEDGNNDEKKNYEDTNKQLNKLQADHVILATGGFASDRSEKSYLAQYRPDLLNLAATAGPFSTGDGISLAKQIGADTTAMDKVQVHPTGFVDPKEENNPSKFLAAELMRGVGGLLLDHNGKRFCNELGTRDYVTDAMLSHANSTYARSRQWNAEDPVPTFYLVLGSKSAEQGGKHVEFYTFKGLLTKISGGVKELGKWMHIEDSQILKSTLQNYQQVAASSSGKKEADEFGKTLFPNVMKEDLEKETFFVGTVTPVLHYCMGGVKIDKHGRVLDHNGNYIQGLFAAGEAAGGVHGENRLAGNSLLECTVFGSVIGMSVPVLDRLPN